MNNTQYQLSDIHLKPRKSIVDHRAIDCDISVKLGEYTFAAPVIPANMSSVVDDETCRFFAKCGWFYVNHRFNKEDYQPNTKPRSVDPFSFIENMQEENLIASISVGVNNFDYDLLDKLIVDDLNPEYITLDIANAYSLKAESMIKYIKDNFHQTFLIVGNCATEEAVDDISKWGADAIKVGIANGMVCTTYKATGFGRPQFSTVLECAEVSTVPIISDGGCREIGDFSKALVAGATMVMAGGMFAGFDQSAGEKIIIGDKSYKQYFGSASYNNKLNNNNIEGTCVLIDSKGDIQPFLHEVEDGLKSAISYAGGKDLTTFIGVDWYHGS